MTAITDPEAIRKTIIEGIIRDAVEENPLTYEHAEKIIDALEKRGYVIGWKGKQEPQ